MMRKPWPYPGALATPPPGKRGFTVPGMSASGRSSAVRLRPYVVVAVVGPTAPRRCRRWVGLLLHLVFIVRRTRTTYTHY